MRILILALCAAVLAACQSQPYPLPTTSQNPASEIQPDGIAATPSERVLQTAINGNELIVTHPAGWETLATANGVILSENGSSIQNTGSLDGMLVYIFLPEDATIPESDPFATNTNHALNMLREVIRLPSYIGEAQVMDPVPFGWGQHEAAYYTLNSGNERLTLLLAVTLPPETLVVYNVTVPADEADTMREELPGVIRRVSVNGQTLFGNELENLPRQLRFPPPNSDVEIASENTPMNP